MRTTYEEIANTCACFHLRRASRFVTAHYDQALGPEKLTSTQFVLLLTLAMTNDMKMSDIAKGLGMDRTTLTRLMTPLIHRKLIRLALGNDRRIKLLTLTPKGKAALERGVPLWKQAQSTFNKIFSSDEWATMVKRLEKTNAL